MTTLYREELIRALPYARRYARALTGNQQRGDQLVGNCLRDLVGQHVDLPPAITEARHALYWGVTLGFDREGLGHETILQDGPRGLSAKHRQLLLLTSLEDVTTAEAALIVGIDEPIAAASLADGRDRLRAAAATDVLIIEDEPIIAMDLEELVQTCGHRVVGVASSEAEAIEIAARARPGLILADINLGAGGDGSSAVAAILRHHYAPVIFVTAYPERLLTGEAVEPAFVITKPFEPLTLAIATYQAVTGGVHLDEV